MLLIEDRLISDAGLAIGFLHDHDPRDAANSDWFDDRADLESDCAALAAECASARARAHSGRN